MKTMHICDNISPNSSQNEKCSDKNCIENQNTFYVQYRVFENRAFYEIMWTFCIAGQATDENMAHAH